LPRGELFSDTRLLLRTGAGPTFAGAAPGLGRERGQCDRARATWLSLPWR